MSDFAVFHKPTVMDDGFISLPMSAKALYFILGINTDSDGDCNCPKAMARLIGATDEDLNLLKQRKYIEDKEMPTGFLGVHVYGAIELEDRT